MANAVRYAELRCRSCFSFLSGASHPEELVARASELGLAALAITDRDGLHGIVRAYAEAKRRSLPLLVGAEVTCDDLLPQATKGTVVLLAQDREGYANLCRILTQARQGGAPGSDRTFRREEPGVSFQAIAERGQGLFALYPGEDAVAAARLREAFGAGRLALAISRHHVAGEELRVAAARSMGRRLGLSVAVVNDVHTHERRRQTLQDVLTCIRLGTTVEQAGRRLFPNAEWTLKGPEEMAQLWSDFPEGLETACAVAESCRFRLEEIRGEHPLPPIEVAAEVEVAPSAIETTVPAGVVGPGPAVEVLAATDLASLPAMPTPSETAAGMALLRRLVEAGGRQRFPGGVSEQVAKQIARELELVEHLGYASYFLTVWDVVRFARSRGILCQGRGSAANSVVCYLLGITSIDPVRMGLLFERFISVERGEPPDIDVDFEHERREEVLQYVYEKYGRDHAGMVCEVISYRAKSALRDVGKALGLSLAQVDRLSKAIGSYEELGAVTPELLAGAGLGGVSSVVVRQTLALARMLLGFPRHLSIHVGGFVITRRPLCETVPIEPAAMAGRTVVQWDKDDLAELGLLKVDLLALGMLTALSRGLELLARHRPPPMLETAVPHPDSLAAVPAEDPAVYAMISQADTIGVFQIESRAQMSLLPRLKPKQFYDLVISVAIIRPGPIQGGMVHPFLRRRDGLEEVRYPYAPLKAVLAKTLGVPLFQEQAMRLAVVAAGFTPGEADELRRVMTHKRSHERMEEMKSRLLSGMAQREISQADGEAIFKQLLGFAGYGFPESHAASFAILVYASAWLKRYHPAAFACALLNSQPMGFYAPHTLVEDAKRHGVVVRGVDVGASDWECTLEDVSAGVVVEEVEDFPGLGEGLYGPDGPARVGPMGPALRIGLSAVAGLPRVVGEAVVTARRERAFESMGDLARRARLPRGWLVRLAEAGVLRSLVPVRREAIWQALGYGVQGGELFEGRAPEEAVLELPAASVAEEIAADYSANGLSERAHPMSILRPSLAGKQVRTAQELRRMEDRVEVVVAGLVIVRQRPGTARGLVFLSLEDETGIANLVLMPEVYERFRPVARGSAFILAQGRVERQGVVVNVRVSAMEPISLIPGLRSVSRDFH